MKLFKLALIFSLSNLLVFPSFASLRDQLKEQEALNKKEDNAKNLIASKCNINTAKFLGFKGMEQNKPIVSQKGYIYYRLYCIIDNQMAAFLLSEIAATKRIDKVGSVKVLGKELDKSYMSRTGNPTRNQFDEYSIDGISLNRYTCYGLYKCNDPKYIIKETLGYKIPEVWREQLKKKIP